MRTSRSVPKKEVHGGETSRKTGKQMKERESHRSDLIKSAFEEQTARLFDSTRPSKAGFCFKPVVNRSKRQLASYWNKSWCCCSREMRAKVRKSGVGWERDSEELSDCQSEGEKERERNNRREGSKTQLRVRRTECGRKGDDGCAWVRERER